MNKKQAVEIIKKLIETYPDAKCSLNYTTPFEMLVSVILSAQCTDERVNKTTPLLFEKFNTPEAIANMKLEELEKYIKSCGFYKNKAKNIKAMSQTLVEKFASQVPNNMEELMSLAGVGRKTANVVMMEVFNEPQGIAVDTHVKRLSNRIGFSKQKDPEKIEKDLIKLIPKEYFKKVNHVLIWHGRKCCKAQNPQCENCPINEFCSVITKTKLTKIK